MNDAPAKLVILGLSIVLGLVAGLIVKTIYLDPLTAQWTQLTTPFGG